MVSALLSRLHDAQNRFYGGDTDVDFSSVLSGDVVWTVPGHSSIAGEYRGIDEVVAYFVRRRLIADATFQMSNIDILTGDGPLVAAVTNGSATIDNEPQAWSTIGLYRIEHDKIAACWLLPLDPTRFDAIWTST